MLRFISRHAIGILVVIVIAGWGLFYVPGTPSYAIFQLKQAIDARDGAGAAPFIDFTNVVKNAGYEMVQKNADKSGAGAIGAMVGKGAVDLLARPLAAAVKQWAIRQVDDGAQNVQMPAAAVAGSIFLLHRSGDAAWTNFRDPKGQQWEIRLAREDGRWRVVEVKNVEQLIERLRRDEETRLGHPLAPGAAPPAAAPPAATPPGGGMPTSP